MNRIVIRKLKEEEWDDAISLIWKTFLRFEAGDYEEEGIRSFLDFISDERLKKMWQLGEYPIYVAWEEKRQSIVGVVSYRNENLLSLLFVEASYQKQGIGRALVWRVREEIASYGRKKQLLVRSSPYATGFYHRLGFCDTDREQFKQGIRYTPMSLELL